MGIRCSKEEEESLYSQIYIKANESNMIPDISVDVCLERFSGLNSADVLEDYLSQLLSDLRSKAPELLTHLQSALAALDSVPGAVGLGALIITVILDSIRSSQNKDGEDMLRRVFAEEKASGVRDSIDECIKRLSMFINDPIKSVQEIERLEKQLSHQLTRLRNSMLHDDQINSRVMKFWTNGAAFHSQMLVHAARLKMADNIERNVDALEAPINTVLDLYQKDLQELLKKYKIYRTSMLSLHMDPDLLRINCTLVDKELGKDFTITNLPLSLEMGPSLDAYVEHMFKSWKQIKQLEEYFSDLKKNTRELILQKDAFNKTKLIPDSDTGVPEEDP